VGEDSWWTSHWEEAPAAIVALLAEVGIDLGDLGCRDGIRLPVSPISREASVVGFIF
jgi:hypothetical protein